MNASCYAIAITLFSSMGQGSKYYTRSSINTLRKNLSKYHQINIGRRWTFQNIANMIKKGYVARRARYRRYGDGQITQIPSLYSFTINGIKFLVSRRVTGAAKLLKAMLEYITGKDQRWPQKEDVEDLNQEEVFRPSKEAFDKLRGIVMKPIGQK